MHSLEVIKAINARPTTRAVAFKIARVTELDYSVRTDVLLCDGSYRADNRCRLTGNVLKSHEQRGDVRVGGLLKVTLGDKSFAAVAALKVGESVDLTK